MQVSGGLGSGAASEGLRLVARGLGSGVVF